MNKLIMFILIALAAVSCSSEEPKPSLNEVPGPPGYICYQTTSGGVICVPKN